MNGWLIAGLMISTSLLAQQATNSPAAAPIENPAAAPAATAPSGTEPAAPPATSQVPPAGNAAAAKPAKKSPSKKKTAKKAAPKTSRASTAAAQLRTVPLVPGPAVVVANRVNVRGQAKLNSEVVTQMTKGQDVTVVEEITLKNSAPDEPSAWAKIVLPSTVHVWVNAPFIQAADKTVIPKRLNMRSGPGENYSVLGRLQKGETVKELGVKGDWMEIEAPTNAYAFMAAQYLKQEAPGAIASTTPTAPVTTPSEPAPAPAPVTEPPAVAAAPTETPTPAPAAEAPAVTNAPATTTAAAEPTAPEPTVSQEPPPKRVVMREGLVRGTVSVQAPSHFELLSPDNGKVIDYLYTPSPDLDLRRYKGLHIIVTGEEGLDERWRNTPVLTIEKIEVLE